MNLDKYLEESKISIVEFGRTVRIHPSQLSRYLNGVHSPNLEQAERIRRASNGKVTFKDWLKDDTGK